MKNKKITIYELTGLIKDDKAPKKIKFDEDIYTYVPKEHNYKDSEGYSLFGYDIIDITYSLNSPVEILPEENDEWEDIEEINNSVDDTLFTMECYTGIPEKAQDWNFGVLKIKINSLIKNQKRIIEKLESKDEN